MAYAEHTPSPKGDYWRGRYKDEDGKYVSVCDEHGYTIRFRGKRDALKAAEDRESDVRNGRAIQSARQRITFEDWANIWYSGLALTPGTMRNYRVALENHLVPFFGDEDLARIDIEMIDAWEAAERKDGKGADSIGTWRGVLSTCLGDAVGKYTGANPALRPKRRGRRSGRGKRQNVRRRRKAAVSPSEIMAIAERASIITGRDQEFVQVWTQYTAALRIGEVTGLEREHVRPGCLSVEWQLAEIAGIPGLLRCPPKDDSYGDIDLPPYMDVLLDAARAAYPADGCECHGQTYMFRGRGHSARRGEVTLAEVAALAGVSRYLVSATATGKPHVAPGVRARVQAAIDETGYTAAGVVWHDAPSAFRKVLRAAITGWFPEHGKAEPASPVLLAGDWPGTRVQGRNAVSRAEFCWLPASAYLSTHGLRRAARTRMEERGIPDVAAEERLRHEIGGVSGAYRIVTRGMREEILGMLTEDWEEALEARLGLSRQSPVAVLGRLLKQRSETRKPRVLPRDSPEPRLSLVSGPDSGVTGRRHERAN